MVETCRDVLRGLITPTFVVDCDSKLLAMNKYMIGLLDVLSRNFKSKSFLGRSVQSLPITLVPTTKPTCRDWASIFRHLSTRTTDLGDSDVSEHIKGTDDLTDSFWDNEEQRQEVVVCDALFTYRSVDPDKCFRLRSQMSVHMTDADERGVYVVSFARPRSDPLGYNNSHRSGSEGGQDQSFQSMFLFDNRSGEDSIAQSISFLKDNEFLRPETMKLPGSAKTFDVYQTISKIIPHMVAVLNVEGQVMFLSRSFYDFTGMSEAQCLGTGWTNIIHPDDVQHMVEEWAEILSTGKKNWVYETRYQRHDGIYKYFLVRAQAVTNADGDIVMWYASMMDVHEIVMAKQQADRRKRSLLTLLANTDVSLWGLDRDGQAYIREGRLPWSPTLKRTIQGTSKNNSLATDLSTTLEAILNGEEFSATQEHEVDGHWYRTTYVADKEVSAEKGTPEIEGVLGLTVDITDLKAYAALQLENERLTLTERAAHEASKMKSAFLANMSHEIRTPIAAIIGLSELLEDMGLDAAQLEMFQGISQSASSLLGLINEILDLSKIESGKMTIDSTSFSPRKLADELESLMGLQARSKDFSFSCESQVNEDLHLLGDFGKLRQILINLLSNSFKFTTSGYVKLEIGPTQPIASHQRNGSSISNFVTLQCKVEDTGCGIAPDVVKKLFQPFTQADSSTARTHGGSGLGLAISRKLSELMGGSLELESELHSGTTTTVRIPFMLDEVSKSSAKIMPAAENILKRPKITTTNGPNCNKSTSGYNLVSSDATKVTDPVKMTANHDTTGTKLDSKTRVLVVEDNTLNRKVVMTRVQKLGYEATFATNGQEALDLLASTPIETRPHIILMDCMMPIMDGYEATKRIREDVKRFGAATSQVPIIALTASAIKGEQEKCEEAGMNDYLTKPASVQALRQVLEKYLDVT